jgi:FkbM family methyltransferase
MIPNGLIGRAVGIYRREGALALGAAACRSVYARSGLRDTVLELLYRRSGPSTVVRADGVSVTFRTVTASEFRRVRNLMDERGTIGDLLSELRTDDVFYDIGANVGMYSCFVAKVLSEGRVVAFEPHPANTEALTENLDLNGFDAVVRRIALSDRRGDTVLTETSPEAGAGGHSLSPEGSGQGLHVETDTLDRTVDAADLPPPTVAKIDVEGAEGRVLEGGAEVLAADSCRLLYCEVHPQRLGEFGDSYRTVVRTIEELGFTTDVIDGEPGRYAMIKGRKRAAR